MGEKYNMYSLKWFRLLFIFVTTPVLSYRKLECPARTEWKFRAVSNCNISEGYHCLFNENTDEFEEFCDTRSYNDPAGHKLVLVGDLDRRDCEGTRYQPFSFSTNGMSSCIFEKTYCREEGQVIHTDGTADSDRQCRCDYTRSYAFIIMPKQSCYCVPSKEDCSCYKKPCPLDFIMTPDYECVNKTVWTGKFTCALIHYNNDKESKPTTAFIPNSKETDNTAYNSSNEYKTVFTVLVAAAILSVLAFMMIAFFLDRAPIGSVNGHIQMEEVMRENLELKNRLDNPIPQNIKELQNYEKKQWKERLHRFVETKAFTTVLESMTKSQCILVSGPQGCGKSSLAFYIALTMEETEEFELLIVTIPDDIVRYASKDKKQIFIIDDIFGKYNVHDYDCTWWSKQGNLVRTLMDRNKNSKILATCRSYIYNSVDIVTVKNAFVHHSLIEEDMELTESDRRTIGKSYLSDATIDQLGKDVIMKYSFFPALCADYLSDTKETVVEYFSTPYNYVAAEIEKCNKSKDLNYFSLALVVMLNNNVRKEMLIQDTSIYNELIQSLAKEIGYTQTPSKQSLRVCLSTLIGSYVIETESEYFFMNEMLFYIIAHVLSKHILRTLLKYGRTSFLKDRVKFLSLDGHFPKLTIMIPDTLESAYFDRILCNIKMGLFWDVLTDTQNYFAKFREAFILYMRPKLKCSDLKDSDNGSTVLHAVSLHGYEDYLKYFIELDKSLVNKGNSSGQIPLHLACLKGHSHTAQLLIEKRTFIDKTDDNENTPLDVACAHGHKDTVDVLLFHKATIKQKPKELKTALHVVCRNGNRIIAEMLLKRNAKVDIRDKAGQTPLHLATLKGHGEIVELLIQHNSDVNLADYKGRTAIYLACEKKHTKIVELLLKCNANTLIDNADGKRPIHCCCEVGCSDITQLLLSHHVDINLRDSGDSTPLHWACKKNHERIVKMLLEKNADVSLFTKYGNTPLHIACINGHINIIKMLLDYKANVNCTDIYDKTPLHLTCEHGLQDAVSLLLVHRADDSAKDKESKTPLHLACFDGNENIVEELCKHGVSVDATEKYGRTPLHICCEQGHSSLIKILKRYGTDINKKEKEGLTPLYIACREDNVDTIKLLLTLGAHINETDKDGWTPLYLACKESNIEMAKILIPKGANINQADKDGITPLHLTAQAGNASLTKLLLESKASVNMVENLGQTPIFKSLSAVQKDVTELLLQNGASVNVSDKFGMTPIRIALQKRDSDVINLLKHYNE
ncbi:uncharacterized protein LOC127714719 [Mytilus californianus]|uniref:uncharacterized protein LOC127714719 n=1 Tax=Mytilus californianus TaxID=6549 RepID=UPI0022468639|nr:uncharacterized protein LOC127714719 [Mytilus californianus]XP_052076732.1 uncharacterized protein LOC127714719 [Mytilus californianus]